jgi:hypothetical protein
LRAGRWDDGVEGREGMKGMMEDGFVMEGVWRDGGMEGYGG